METLEIKLEGELKIKALLFIDSVNQNNTKISSLNEEIRLKKLEIDNLNNASEMDKIKFFLEAKQQIPEDLNFQSRSLKQTDDNEVFLLETFAIENETIDNLEDEGIKSNDLDVDLEELLDSIKSLEALILDEKNQELHFDSPTKVHDKEDLSFQEMVSLLKSLKNLGNIIEDNSDNSETNKN